MYLLLIEKQVQKQLEVFPNPIIPGWKMLSMAWQVIPYLMVTKKWKVALVIGSGKVTIG